MKQILLIFISVLLISKNIQAQVAVKDDGSTVTGSKAAEKYMGVKPEGSDRPVAPLAMGADTHFLALHLGTFVDDVAYNWGGPEKKNDIGALTAGVTYRIGEWVNSMDLLARGDFTSYKLNNESRAIRLSLMPVVTFPDAASGFPLYFGAGAGLGIFFKQIENESSLSFDYQIFGGIRFFNVIETAGFFVEVGLKNSVLLLSDGQFNGLAVSLGTIFNF